MPSASQTDPILMHAERLLTYYGYSFMLIFGNIGNCFNIVLFSRKKLRKTSCNNYFLASSFTNLIALNVSIISMIYIESNPEKLSIGFCKLEVFIMTITLQMSRFFILAACFDRYASSSTNVRLRKFSHPFVARRYIIPSIIILWTIVPIHVPIFVTVKEKSCIFEGFIELYNCIYGIVLVGTIPPGLMFLFSMLIFQNLRSRQQRRQIHPFTIGNSLTRVNHLNMLKRKDQQVLAMLLVQVLAYIASSTPYTITLLYVVLKLQNDSLTTGMDADPTMLFILFITDMLRFVCPFISFYLFVLVSRLYRKEILLILIGIYRRCLSIYERSSTIDGSFDLNPSIHPTTCVRRIEQEQDFRLSTTADRIII